MKRSDVEWLGQVPAHWEVTRLGRFGKFLKGNGGTKDDEASSGIPCVRYGDLYTTHEFVVLQARSFVSKEKVKDYTSIRFGDVLFAASGETIDEIGKSAANLIPSEACCGGDVIIFRPSREVDARYIGYATDCLPSRIQKATMGRGITVMHVYGHQLKRLSLALPPFPEQTANSSLPRLRRPPDTALHPRQTEADRAAGGTEAGHHPPGRHGRDRCPHQPALPSLQGLWRGVAWRSAGALGGGAIAKICG